MRFSFDADALPKAFEVFEFSGREEISDCFAIEVDLVSFQDDIDLNMLLDTSAVLTVAKRGQPRRYIHGVIAEIERRAVGLARTVYRVTLCPSLHRLRYISDSRIFQKLSVPDIAKVILAENGIVDVEWRVERAHPSREFCVCYQETLYDFLLRLFADEGIFFWFQHSKGGHKLIVSDSPFSMPVLEAAPTITFNGSPGGYYDGMWVSRFTQIDRLRATRRVSRDYTFKSPANSQDVQAVQTESNGAKGQYELFAYPGGYKDPGIGQTVNNDALEAHRVDATTAEGVTNCVHLSSGFTFQLTDHPVGAANISHRLVKVRHSGRQGTALEEEASDAAVTSYSASFTCQPARLPYRAKNPNLRQKILGPQIAHVTGPEGEEIYCDEHGRVKLWFPWDRHGKQDESSSCWIRVGQNWAGGTMGSIAIPRVGHEVIVEFLDGDPDQPIITGRTFHATNRTPYQLPANRTKMVMRSQVPGDKGFNEMSFEDQPGKEELFIQAQRRKVEIVGKSSLEIQTDGIGEEGAAQVVATHAAYIGASILAAGLLPLAVPTATLTAFSKEAEGELRKRRN
ncbi:MAG: type VI secretion system tip protein VgrG [Rhizobiaceae bacterium]|nr:type VI secretion system tip protein VgrG [Rhizobiaceae bacterium]